MPLSEIAGPSEIGSMGQLDAVEAGFDAQMLVENFELLADASNASKKLRALVLKLGLAGRLGTNDSAESPVPIGPRTPLAVLPPYSNWTVSRLPDVADIEMGNSPPGTSYNDVGDGVPLINGPVEFSPGPFGLTRRTKFTTAPARMCRKGDLLVCVRGATTGRTNIADFDACIGRGVALVRARGNQNYLNYFMWSVGNDLLAAGTGTTFPAISREDLDALVVLLPPLAEQKRIVARVDQLMALIDDLEGKQTKKRDLSTRFTKASLEALTTAESPEAFDTAWQRVVENFRAILDECHKVAALRARILALAVAGRLCRSENDARPANEELADILAVRRARIDKDPAPPADGTRPSIPSTWCWTSLDALLVVLRNGVSTRPEGSDGVPVLRISAVRPNAVQMSELRFLPGSRGDYAGFFVKPGDLLITRYSGNAEFVGACGVVPAGAHEVVHPDKLIRGEVVPDLVDPNFVALAMSTGASRAYIDLCGQTTAGQIGISGKQLKSAPIPLPPLAEQKRIVSKVGHLMKLCDDLEAKFRCAEERASKLVEAVVKEIVA